MDAYPEVNGATDVVFNIHWTLTGAEDSFSGSVYGSQTVAYDAAEPLTPYANLTETQVLGWLQAAMGEEQVAKYEANVAQQIADQINPPVVNPPLPWG
jgi:hypothetical protein